MKLKKALELVIELAESNALSEREALDTGADPNIVSEKCRQEKAIAAVQQLAALL